MGWGYLSGGNLRTLCLLVSGSLWQGEGLEGQTWGRSLCLVQAKEITPSSDCSGHLTVELVRTEAGGPGQALMAFLTRFWGTAGGMCEHLATHHWGIGKCPVPKCLPEGRESRRGSLHTGSILESLLT